MPKLPTRTQIEKFISGAGQITSLKLWIIYKTGFRPVEIHDLRVKDLDSERNTLNATTHKNGIGRTNKIPPELTKALLNHISKYNLKPTDKLFQNNAKHFGDQFRLTRKRLAQKLNDPSLLTVRLYDLRHYYGTMHYIETRDLPITANDMGHKDYNTTRKYLHLARIIEILESDEQYIIKTAETVDQAKQLLEVGYQYIQDLKGISLYRKRK